MNDFYWYLFVVSLTLSFISTPIISRVAFKNGIVDQPGERKVHHEPKPLMGGLAIFLAFVTTMLIFIPVTTQTLSILLGGTIVLIVGIVDDIHNIKPLVKLTGQVAAAVVLVSFNLHSYSVILDFIGRFYIPEFVTAGLLICWIVFIINAFNLIDGLDGLAGGTAVIVALALALVALLQNNLMLLGVLIIGIGACLGFLPYNVHRAKIFMGDAGSMMLGFFLVVMHLFVVTTPFSVSLVLATVFIFIYPILDVTYAIYRRLRNKGSIFNGDQGHIHHILLRIGFTVRQAVFILWLMNLVFAGTGIFLLRLTFNPWVLLTLGAFTLAAVAYFFYYLNRLSRALNLEQAAPVLSPVKRLKGLLNRNIDRNTLQKYNKSLW